MYLNVDVLLFTSLFETFRKEFIYSFELDPTHCLFTSDYGGDVMLRFTDGNLNLMSNIEKYQFVESAMSGGISIICNSYAKANNIFLKSCNANKTSLYIIYLHANNLSEHSMMKLLPTEIVDWVNSKDFNLDNYSDKNPIVLGLQFIEF